MKVASKYIDWTGPISLSEFKKLKLSKNSLIWFPQLCNSNLTEPFKCDHEPITVEDFEKLRYETQYVQIFYNKIDEDYSLKKIALWTALIGLFTAIFIFGKEFFDDNDEQKPTTTIVICKDCGCNCDYEDVPGEANGKKAIFRIAYLTQEKRWKYSSEIELNDGSLLSDNIGNNLPNFPNFGESLGLISVGTASQEGNNIEKEELRADRRADAILFNVRINELAKNKELYKLNLGQYVDKKKLDISETAYQRRVIIVGIMKKDNSMDFSELKIALKNGLNDSEGLDYDTDKYSRFDLVRQN